VEVSDVLRDRMQQPSGLNRMVTASIAVHATLALALVFAPNGLLSRSRTAPIVMTISLGGGGTGPDNGGMTTMGGRPIQAVRPPDETPKREAVQRPAAKAPEMTMPLPNAKPAKASTSTAKQSIDEARGAKLTKGEKVTPGSTPADTGVRGMGFGLTTGGGVGSGSSIDVKDFCCPEYITTMVTMIRRAWNPNQGVTGETLIKFTIFKDGSIRTAEIERSSGNPVLDNAALRAVLQTRLLPPLPDAFPNSTLPVHLNFQYQ
jgi:periplasmic protein TonB